MNFHLKDDLLVELITCLTLSVVEKSNLIGRL